jgi:hypothetical protein
VSGQKVLFVNILAMEIVKVRRGSSVVEHVVGSSILSPSTNCYL